MPFAKLVVPIVMAMVGVGAAVTAAVTHEAPAVTEVSTAAQVWIDAPTDDVAVAPGVVHVGAHATAEGSIGSLELFVDGDMVATDTSLEENGKLVYAAFEWTADEGRHELVVVEPGTDRQSLPVGVIVTSEVTAGPEDTTTTVPTTVPEETVVSTLPPDGVTTTTSRVPVTVPGKQPPATTATTAPAPPPVIDSATIAGTRVYRLTCGYPDVTVSARARNATSVSVTVEGTTFSSTMTQNGSTYSAAIPSGVWAPGDVGHRRVLVNAVGAGGGDQAVAGEFDIVMTCPKD